MTSLKLNDLLLNMQTTYQSASSYITWTSLVMYGGLSVTTWCVYKLFVEPLLSPLRKMPGMAFNPILGNMRQILVGEAMEATIKMMKEYGTLCRYYFIFGRERLMVADPDVLKHILVTNNKNYIKPPARFHLMRMVLGEGLVMSEGATHAAHKRLMSPSFNNNSVKKMIPVMVRRVQYTTQHWLKQIHQADVPTDQTVQLNIQEVIARTTLDIVGEIAFGYDFNSLENPDNEVNTSFQRILTGSGLSWRLAIPYYHKLPMPDVMRFKNDTRIMRQVVMDVINNKKALLAKGNTDAVSGDILGQMLLAKDENGQGMSPQELNGEVTTLMLAGHETTAVGTSWCLLTLAQNPVVQQRARDEILSVLPDKAEDITWEHLEQLKFLGCIIKETLRLLPPVPFTLRQSLKDDYLSTKDSPKYFIPAGTISMLSMGPMMRREDLFDSPNEFIPERFLDSEVDKNFYNYIPFLIGPRMCIGYKFALLEMRIMLALFLKHMHFETVPGVHTKRQSRITMRPSPSLKLMVKQV